MPRIVNNNGKEKILTKDVEIIWEKISPDKSNNAVMFSNPEDKTATVRYQLSIIPNGKKITKEDTANVFSYDGIYDIEWEDETTLLVKKYEEGIEYYKIEEYNGIKIKYLSPSETREHEKKESAEELAADALAAAGVNPNDIKKIEQQITQVNDDWSW